MVGLLTAAAGSGIFAWRCAMDAFLKSTPGVLLVAFLKVIASLWLSGAAQDLENMFVVLFTAIGTLGLIMAIGTVRFIALRLKRRQISARPE